MRYEVWGMRYEDWGMWYEVWGMRYEVWGLRYEWWWGMVSDKISNTHAPSASLKVSHTMLDTIKNTLVFLIIHCIFIVTIGQRSKHWTTYMWFYHALTSSYWRLMTLETVLPSCGPPYRTARGCQMVSEVTYIHPWKYCRNGPTLTAHKRLTSGSFEPLEPLHWKAAHFELPIFLLNDNNNINNEKEIYFSHLH